MRGFLYNCNRGDYIMVFKVFFGLKENSEKNYIKRKFVVCIMVKVYWFCEWNIYGNNYMYVNSLF